MLESFSIILTLTSVFSYINYRWSKLCSTISLMIIALCTAVLIISLKSIIPSFYGPFYEMTTSLHFEPIVMDMMLSFLLFSGAIPVNLARLGRERILVLTFSTIAVLISTFYIGCLFYYTTMLFEINIPFLHCLLFGALISPTTPIAALTILENTGISKNLKLKIEGESLFNGGIVVIIFMGVLSLIETKAIGSNLIIQDVVFPFLQEAVGGILIGIILGFGGWKLIQSIQENRYWVLLLTIVFVLSGYAVAAILNISEPLTMLAAGLLVGHKINQLSFDSSTRKTLNAIWKILNNTLNAVLLVMIGLVIHSLDFSMNYIVLSIIGVAITIFARFVSISVPFFLLKYPKEKAYITAGILTWVGLRGGISIALALSLSSELPRDLLIFMTFSIVLFSIIVQGLSLRKLIHLAS